MNGGRVFGIGFHKTGTTTLRSALSTLGYRVCGVQLQLAARLSHGDYSCIAPFVDRFDAFTDNPWPVLFRHLEASYPDSKFILTTRDTDRWIASVVNHFRTTTTMMREWIYGAGAPVGHETTYVRRFEAHNAAVRDYFLAHGRASRLLEVSWEKGDGWPAICDFLDKPIPSTPFAHANPARYPTGPAADRRARECRNLADGVP